MRSLTARPAPGAAALLLSIGAVTGTAAVEVRTFSETPATLIQGAADGIAVTDGGRMFLAPRVDRLGKSGGDGPAHVWSMLADERGDLLLGTGPDGRILRITAGGERSELFRVEEPMVTALARLPGGDLIAGTAPEGLIYRIGRDGKGGTWAETGERYVWSLAVGPGGRVFAGTGESGRILEIDRSGKVQPFFDTDEAHVVRLVALADGTLLAGGAGRGRIYQIDGEGHGLVIHDDDLPEVTGIAVEPDGSVVASLLAPPPAAPRRPAVRIRLPEPVPGRGGGETLAELEDEETTPTLEGFIEGLPLDADLREAQTRGRLVRIAPDGTVREIWSSNAESPYCLARDDVGRVLFGTGEPGRIYRVEPEGDVALLATVREAQLSALSPTGSWLGAATSNPGSVYRIDRQTPEAGVFVSRPIDAGGTARWGRIRWTQDGRPGRVEFYTRTGNSSTPDATWSAWSPALTVAAGSPIVNPEGRFLQWRVRLVGSGATPISAVRVSFAPFNRAPDIRDFGLDPARPAVSGRTRLRWSARDPDGDPVRVEVQYQTEGASEWLTAAVFDPEEGPGPDWQRWREGELSWDTKAIAEGSYRLRALASDEGANHPGEGIVRPSRGVPLVTVDRTAPGLTVRQRPGGGWEVEVVDDGSGVRRLELVRDGRTRFTARPEDGVCDSGRERFVLDPSLLDGEGWRLRAVDAAGNSAEQAIER